MSLAFACADSGRDEGHAPGNSAVGEPTLVTVVEPDALAVRLSAGSSECCGPGQLILQLAGEPQCTVHVYSFRYQTSDGRGEPAEASGALMVPSGTAGECSGPRPVALYTHGTTFERGFDMIEGGEGTNLEHWEWLNTVAFYAARGYIVVAPNYVGYAGSDTDYHPYLDGEQQGRDVVDSLLAARTYFASVDAEAARELFITGYSQGGYVAMATQRVMQRDFADKFDVAAMAAGAGPYALANMIDTIFMGAAIPFGSFFMPLIVTSWQKAYGDVYVSPDEFYATPYAETAPSAVPSELSIPEIVAQGQLPPNALFEATSIPGPVMTDPALGLVFAGGFAETGFLIDSAYRDRVVEDVSAQPCATNDSAAPDRSCEPETGLRRGALRNDLRDFVPEPPLLLCAAHSDAIVLHSNTELMAAYLREQGKSDLTVVDMDPGDVTPSGEHADLQAAFVALREGVKAAAESAGQHPDVTFYSLAHNLAVSFCHAAAIRHFEQGG